MDVLVKLILALSIAFCMSSCSQNVHFQDVFGFSAPPDMKPVGEKGSVEYIDGKKSVVYLGRFRSPTARDIQLLVSQLGVKRAMGYECIMSGGGEDWWDIPNAEVQVAETERYVSFPEKNNDGYYIRMMVYNGDLYIICTGQDANPNYGKSGVIND